MPAQTRNSHDTLLFKKTRTQFFCRPFPLQKIKTLMISEWNRKIYRQLDEGKIFQINPIFFVLKSGNIFCIYFRNYLCKFFFKINSYTTICSIFSFCLIFYFV